MSRTSVPPSPPAPTRLGGHAIAWAARTGGAMTRRAEGERLQSLTGNDPATRFVRDAQRVLAERIARTGCRFGCAERGSSRYCATHRGAVAQGPKWRKEGA